MLYHSFEMHMEPATLHRLAEVLRANSPYATPVMNGELLNLACEIEARLQKFALGKMPGDKKGTPADDDWLL